MPRDPASFRDPAGHVHHSRDGRIYRSILPPGVENYRAARDSGFLAAASRSGRLIEGHEVDPALLRDEAPDAVHVVEHPRLDFISYPYEWSFFGLRAAALLTLDLHLEALSHGLTLSDASAYNVQFVGPRPVFIDYLSPIKYEEGQVWLGYRQFCEQFLNPLLLTAKTGFAFQALYRGTLEGLGSADLGALLPFRAKLNPRVALHVVLQGRLQRTVTIQRTATARKLRLSKTALRNNIESMRSWVATLAPPASQVTPWQSYEQTAQYTPEERGAKAQFVAEVVAATRPRTVWSLGCNSGEYDEIALKNGAGSVIGFEPDAGALNAAYQRAATKHLSFLPLAIDLTNPSPSLGWRQQERLGLAQRRNADLVTCLALLHHLVLGRDLAVAEVLDWLVALAPAGIVEFVPKQDPMAQQLLTWKPHVAPDYDCASVGALLRQRARIEREEVVTASGRVLFAFSRL
ncbi:MAG: class I SAM-dependent methyltransferase [Gemmatimonadota bacterium]